MITLKKITFIIITWNNAEIIRECIDTLIEFSKFENEIIIVDNASKDTTCDVLKLYGDKIKLIESQENLGFSKANNLALQNATGDFIFYVNPDVIFIEDVLTPMVDLLENNQDIGVVSPKLLYKDYSYQVSTCNFPSATKLLWDDCHLYKLLSKKKKMKYAQAQWRGSENRFVDWTYGAAHLCRKSDVLAVGGYPEGYFMYGEDTEFCMYFLDKLNKKTYYLGECSLIHLGGYSEKQVVNSKKIVYGTNAAMYFVNKYYGKGSLFRYRFILFCVSYLKYIAYSFQYLFKHSQKNLNGKVKWKASWKTVLKYDKGKIN